MRKYDLEAPTKTLAEQLLVQHGANVAEITAKRFAGIARARGRIGDAVIWDKVFKSVTRKIKAGWSPDRSATA